jgi:hypothetical protein
VEKQEQMANEKQLDDGWKITGVKISRIALKNDR